MPKLTAVALATIIGLGAIGASPAWAKHNAIAAQERRQKKADARHERSRGMIEDFNASNEEKRARQESRWNSMMNDLGRPNDQKDRWLIF